MKSHFIVKPNLVLRLGWGFDNNILDYTTAVLESVEAAARDSLPVSGPGPSTKGRSKPSYKIPGWSELVKPYYEESKFWHKLLVSQGRVSYSS